MPSFTSIQRNVSKCVFYADLVVDAIPVLSTVTNLTHVFVEKPLIAIFLKCGVVTPQGLRKSHYYHLIRNKSIASCLALSVPIFGQIPVWIYNIVKRKEFVLKREAILHMAKPDTPKDYQNSRYYLDALSFAREKLKDPNLKPVSWSKSDLAGPCNPEINLLYTLYNSHFSGFANKIAAGGRKRAERPWEDPDVLQAANDLMKIAYAISILTFEDAENLSQMAALKGIKRSIGQSLSEQDTYAYKAISLLPRAYHCLRGADKRWQQDQMTPLFEGDTCKADDSGGAYTALFYQEGTDQNRWREMYNEFCALPSACKVAIGDGRITAWMRLDEDSEFLTHPGTLPT